MKTGATFQMSVDKPWVVKVGGRSCETSDSRTNLARACAALEHPLVVVHGGGDAVSRLQAALGLEARFVEGRRVTGVADVAAVEMVLSGDVNKSLVRALARAGRPALGISGCDAGLVRCALVPELGRVGTPREVDVRILFLSLQVGLVPVVSPVSLGPDGEPVNVNADEMAAALAMALGAARLLLLSDVEGVQVDAARLETVRDDRVETLVESGTATRGMIPKLRSAARAVQAGVGEVRIGSFQSGRLEDVRGTRVVGGSFVLGNSDQSEGIVHG